MNKLRQIGLVIGLGASVVAHAQGFTLFAAETPAGSLGGNTALYGGIQQYNFANSGGAAVAGPGVAAGLVHDPAGLAVFGSSVFVGNRFGNQGGQGSIQKFNFDGTGLVFDQDITGNGLQRVHGVGVNAASGEVVGVNIFGGGLSRFLPSGSGFTANGAFTSGEARDIVSSADGTKWYVSELSNTIRVIDLVANTQTTFAIAGANQIHQMAWRNGSLYVTGFSSDTVHKVDLDGSGMVTGSSIVLSVNNAIGMAFSPDGQEMFVSEHDGNRIFRFLESGGSWVANGTILTGKSMGYLAAVPEPGTMILVGLGLATVARRRLR